MLICSYNQFLVLLFFSIPHFINVCSHDFSVPFLLGLDFVAFSKLLI